MVGFSGSADTMAQLSMTPRNSVSRSQYSLKVNISQTVHSIHYIFGRGLFFWVDGANGAISGSLDGGAVARNPCDSWAFLSSHVSAFGLSMPIN